MSKSLFNKITYLILAIGLAASSAFCQTSSGPGGDFIRPFPSPTPPRPTPTPTPTPVPTPVPTPTPGTSSASIMGAIVNQRGLGSKTSSATHAGGAANVMGSRSYTYAVPMFSLPGRHGLNLNLALYYNSLIWETVLGGGGVTIGAESPSPSTGFRLDYGYILWSSFSGTPAVLIDATGAKHPLVAMDQTGVQFRTIDSSYISVQHHSPTTSTDPSSDIVTYKNGMQAFYVEAPGSFFSCCSGAVGNSGSQFINRPTKIEDTSGNFITINYVDTSSTNISSIVDTVGRTISFIYNGAIQNLLMCVTDGATCNATGSRTFNFSWNTNYVLNYQFSLYLTGVLGVIPPLQGSQFPYTVLSGVTRPDGTKVQFNYGDWLIVDDIQELSNNGSLRYETNYNFPLASAGPLSDPPTYTQQTVKTFDKDGNAKQAVWLYQAVMSNPIPSEKIVSCFAVTDPVGTSHITTISAQGNIFDGLPIKSVTATGSTAPCTTPPTSVLRSVATQWTTDTDASGALTGTNPRAQTVTTILSDGVTQFQTQIGYDVHGNQTDIKQFDFGTNKPGPLLRETVTTFTSTLGNIFDRPTDIQVKDGAGNLFSHEALAYDNYSTVALQPVSPLPPGFDSANFGSTTSPSRGNLTGLTIYTNAAAGTGAINSGFTYDVTGNMLTSQSGCCQYGTSVFTSATQYAYPDSVSMGPSGSQLTASFVYDMTNGNVKGSTDYNAQKTQISYDQDSRPLSAISLDGTTTSYIYDDASANPARALSSTANGLISQTVKDFSGHTLLRKTLNSTALVSTIEYINDLLGRPIQISNPYGPGETAKYTSYVFDALGRISSFTRPSLTGSTQNSYQFQYNPTTFTDAGGNMHAGISLHTADPAGKERLQYKDALGRLMRVDEPGGQPLSLTTPNSTYYSYDAIGHLLQVIAGQQTRTYQYDSLGRVTRAVIPETGYQAATATYTDFGAPLQVIDPRMLPGTTTHITTTFSYDALNRLKSVTYNDGTPNVTYVYNPTNSANNTGGRLSSMTNGLAAETYQYDLMGRVTLCKKTVGGQDYNTIYHYRADGTVASITYPSGRIVAFGEDAIGRINQVLNSGANLLTVQSFNAAGEILNEIYGNSVTGGYTYNNQLQLASRSYSTPSGSLLSLAYNYGGANDNGQIQSITDNLLPFRSTNYVYDTLERLATAGTNDFTAANSWQLQFAYDRYGNRLSQTPTAGTASMPSSQLLIDPTTNHVTSQGYSYDAAGNMSSDGLFNYAFDAIGEMTSVAPLGSTTAVASFGYDANGLRVLKNNVVYIYSGKKVVAEYPQGTPAASPSREYIYRGRLRLATISGSVITYHYADRLSGRVDTDASGNVIRTYGHYPFGETWYETGTPDKWKFTTYENDSESGLNYATARFHSPRLGRFMSIDPLGGRRSNPQSLNRYVYVNNDPINLTDPTGKVCIEGCDDDDGEDSGEGDGAGDVPGGGGVGNPPLDSLVGPNLGGALVDLNSGYWDNVPDGGLDFTFNADSSLTMIGDLSNENLDIPSTSSDSMQVSGGGSQSDAFQEGSLAFSVFQGSASTWSAASGTMNTLFGIEAGAFALGGGAAIAPTLYAVGVNGYYAFGTAVGAAALTYGGAAGRFAFYSGPGAQAAATTWAEENEGVTIWGTEYGQAFQDGLATGEEASAQYAQNVSGEVHLFSTDPFTNYNNNILYTTELPILYRNPNVTKLIFHTGPF